MRCECQLVDSVRVAPVMGTRVPPTALTSPDEARARQFRSAPQNGAKLAKLELLTAGPTMPMTVDSPTLVRRPPSLLAPGTTQSHPPDSGQDGKPRSGLPTPVATSPSPPSQLDGQVARVKCRFSGRIRVVATLDSHVPFPSDALLMLYSFSFSTSPASNRPLVDAASVVHATAGPLDVLSVEPRTTGYLTMQLWLMKARA
ncbi:hypothetical protein PCL_06423 [Purpureocillium lilacinum]|uniref:Uncharacterized protein n=1 Tax=Purpureocillium lilacinum TaxID=33203 RepID=A0A2U3EMN5_PURLI|nr:hypothetical protein PCL_06423 [Purpureocillium lilacinum]